MSLMKRLFALALLVVSLSPAFGLADEAAAVATEAVAMEAAAADAAPVEAAVAEETAPGLSYARLP